MDRKLDCKIVTPEKILFEAEVDMVIVPGTMGELGILPLHMPLITTLEAGELRVKYGQERQDYIAIDGGYLETREDKVTILADAAEFVSKIDIDKLAKIKETIEATMASVPKDSEEFFAHSAELEKITKRIQIAEKRK